MLSLIYHSSPSITLNVIDIQTYVVWKLSPEEAHLCFVRALADWRDASGVRNGYIFRDVDKKGRVRLSRNQPIVSPQSLSLYSSD